MDAVATLRNGFDIAADTPIRGVISSNEIYRGLSTDNTKEISLLDDKTPSIYGETDLGVFPYIYKNQNIFRKSMIFSSMPNESMVSITAHSSRHTSSENLFAYLLGFKGINSDKKTQLSNHVLNQFSCPKLNHILFLR